MLAKKGHWCSDVHLSHSICVADYCKKCGECGECDEKNALHLTSILTKIHLKTTAFLIIGLSDRWSSGKRICGHAVGERFGTMIASLFWRMR